MKPTTEYTLGFIPLTYRTFEVVCNSSALNACCHCLKLCTNDDNNYVQGPKIRLRRGHDGEKG